MDSLLIYLPPLPYTHTHLSLFTFISLQPSIFQVCGCLQSEEQPLSIFTSVLSEMQKQTLGVSCSFAGPVRKTNASLAWPWSRNSTRSNRKNCHVCLDSIFLNADCPFGSSLSSSFFQIHIYQQGVSFSASHLRIIEGGCRKFQLTILSTPTHTCVMKSKLIILLLLFIFIF